MNENHVRALVAKRWSKLGFVLLLIFVVSFAIRAFRLDFYSLWYDEVNTASLVQLATAGGALDRIINTTGSETLHPLYYLMLSGWVRLAGNSPWMLRFPSVLFGSLAVVVYAALLYQVSKRKTLAFGLLLIVSPFLVWYSRDARPYALIMFLTGLHLLFYLKLLAQPQSKKHLLGFVITGILSVYSGIFVGMLLMAELAWSILRRRPREIAAVVLVLIVALPLVWHGCRTFFQPASDRYRDLPTGINAVRIVGFPQEFLVARSLGPTPDEVRRSPLGEALRGKSLEIGVEIIAIVCIFTSLVACIKSRRGVSASNQYSTRAIHMLGFITVAVCLQAALLIAITGYQMNARHIGFVFGPLFVLCIYPIARAQGYFRKVLFVAPLLVLWTWSSANQLFDSSYVTEDFKTAARIIESGEHHASRAVALCNVRALRYYGVTKSLTFLPESAQVTGEVVEGLLRNDSNPVWLVLSRPWNYPNFHFEDLASYFQILQTKELPGIHMWLLVPNR